MALIACGSLAGSPYVCAEFRSYAREQVDGTVKLPVMHGDR